MKTIRQVSEFLFLYWFNNIFLIYCLKEVKDALGDSCYDRVIHNSSKTTDILYSTFFVFQIIFLHPCFIDFSIVFLILIIFKLFVKLKSNWKLCRYLYAMTYLAVKIANSISIIENDLLIVYKFQKVPGKIRNISLVRIPDKVSNYYYYYFWFGWQYTWWKHFIKIIIYNHQACGRVTHSQYEIITFSIIYHDERSYVVLCHFECCHFIFWLFDLKFLKSEI